LAALGAMLLLLAALDSPENPKTESVKFLILSTMGLVTMIATALVVSWNSFLQGNVRDARWFLGAYSLMLVAIIINLLAYYGLLRSRTATTIFLGSIVAELTVLTVRLCMQGYLLQRKTLELQIALERERTEAMQQLVQSMDKVNQFVGDMLHDEIGALLALTRLNAEQLAHEHLRTTPEAWSQQYTHTLGLIDKTVEEVRQFAHRFSAVPVDRLGLIDSISKQVQEINRTSTTQFEFVGLGDDHLLTRDLSVNAYRILLSLINNILRHAEASHALIQVIVREDSLSMLAEDNGKGFDTRQLEVEGFEFISSRVYAFGGTLSVESVPGNGTVVAIEIPIGRG
jgi:signal transduction histidine kinase